MKRFGHKVALAAIFITPAWAATNSVTLVVPGMTCAACPITVKRTISKLDGVQKVEVDYEKRAAIVTFDDSKIRVETLTQATADAGYPSYAH